MTAVEPLDGDQPAPVPVDLPAQRQPLTAEVLAARTVNKRPLVAQWLRSWSEFRAVLVWLSKYGAHATAFHLGHSPIYLARLIARSPRGGWRVGVLVASWVLDREQQPIRADAVKRSAVSEYLALSKLRMERVKQRAIVAGCGLVVVGIGVVVLRRRRRCGSSWPPWHCWSACWVWPVLTLTGG